MFALWLILRGWCGSPRRRGDWERERHITEGFPVAKASSGPVVLDLLIDSQVKASQGFRNIALSCKLRDDFEAVCMFVPK